MKDLRVSHPESVVSVLQALLRTVKGNHGRVLEHGQLLHTHEVEQLAPGLVAAKGTLTDHSSFPLSE